MQKRHIICKSAHVKSKTSVTHFLCNYFPVNIKVCECEKKSIDIDTILLVTVYGSFYGKNTLGLQFLGSRFNNMLFEQLHILEALVWQ